MYNIFRSFISGHESCFLEEWNGGIFCKIFLRMKRSIQYMRRIIMKKNSDIIFHYYNININLWDGMYELSLNLTGNEDKNCIKVYELL